MSSNITWILVCDAARARIFATEGRRAPWVCVDAPVHPASRAKGVDLVADGPGRVHQRAGTGRSAMEPHTAPKEVEAARFAAELAARLLVAHNEGAYRDVVLVAPPALLGLLRGELDAQVAKTVRATVAKDLTQFADHELPEHLAEALA